MVSPARLRSPHLDACGGSGASGSAHVSCGSSRLRWQAISGAPRLPRSRRGRGRIRSSACSCPTANWLALARGRGITIGCAIAACLLRALTKSRVSSNLSGSQVTRSAIPKTVEDEVGRKRTLRKRAQTPGADDDALFANRKNRLCPYQQRENEQTIDQYQTHTSETPARPRSRSPFSPSVSPTSPSTSKSTTRTTTPVAASSRWSASGAACSTTSSAGISTAIRLSSNPWDCAASSLSARLSIPKSSLVRSPVESDPTIGLAASHECAFAGRRFAQSLRG